MDDVIGDFRIYNSQVEGLDLEIGIGEVRGQLGIQMEIFKMG